MAKQKRIVRKPGKRRLKASDPKVAVLSNNGSVMMVLKASNKTDIVTILMKEEIWDHFTTKQEYKDFLDSEMDIEYFALWS